MQNDYELVAEGLYKYPIIILHLKKHSSQILKKNVNSLKELQQISFVEK